MSILNVDTINEKTTGNGVHITGHTLQTVFNTSLPTSYETISSGSFTNTGVHVSITPKASNSSMLIMCNQHFDSSVGAKITAAIFKDGTIVTPKSPNGTYDGHMYFNRLDNSRLLLHQSIHATDSSVGTTSAVTYKLYVKVHNGDVLLRHDLTSSRIIVQEIAQ